MTPKDKAKQLFNKMYQVDDIMGNYPMCLNTAKECALIAVQEMIELLDELPMSEDVIKQFAYLQDVKQEIKKL